MTQSSDLLLEVAGVAKSFATHGGRRIVHAVDGVDLKVARGEILGLVGESGSGKTTLGRSILRLLAPDRGTVRFDGTDVLGLSGAQMRRFRRRMQLIFQDPTSSLNPRMRVRSLVGEPLEVHGIARGSRLREQVADLLEEVGLDAGAMDLMPHEFSGGQRQRIAIARALAVRPEFVVCDEPVSSLDVSVQAQIINLLVDLQQRHGLAYLFIAHDLALVSHFCDRVVVLYLGRVMESAPKEVIRTRPTHPYSQVLYAASPVPDPKQARRRKALLPDEIPSPSDRPSGCSFHPRCRYTTDLCRREVPGLRELSRGHMVACHHAEDLLRGICEPSGAPQTHNR